MTDKKKSPPRSSNRWRTLEHLFDAVAVFKKDRSLIYGNGRFRELGRLKGDLQTLGLKINECLDLPEEYWQAFLSERNAKENMQVKSAPFKFKNGAKGFAQIVFDRLPAEDNDTDEYYLCVLRDITFEIQSRSLLSDNERVISELKRNHAEAHFLWRLALETPIYLEPPAVLTAVASKLKDDLGFADASFVRIEHDEAGKPVRVEALLRDQRVGSRLRDVAKLILPTIRFTRSRMDVSAMSVEPYGRFWVTQFRPKLEKPFVLLARSEPASADADRRPFLEPLAIQIIEWLDNRAIYIQSITDGLTGLFSRRHFDSRLAVETILARERSMILSVLLFDIDLFKNVNDTYGHPAGDEVLRQIGAILKSGVRTTDIPARLGGEEFCILLIDTSPEDAMVVAEKIRKKVEETEITVPVTGQKIRVTISCGVAGYTNPADTPEVVIKLADDALYKAKKDGRNRVRIANQSI